MEAVTESPGRHLPPLWKAIKKFAPLLVSMERDDFTIYKHILMKTTIIWGGIIPASTVHRFIMAKITYKQYPVLISGAGYTALIIEM